MSKDLPDVNSQSQNGQQRDDGPILSPLAQEEIGRRLRAVYGRMADEPLPDKFSKLLQELAKSDSTESEK